MNLFHSDNLLLIRCCHPVKIPSIPQGQQAFSYPFFRKRIDQVLLSVHPYPDQDPKTGSGWNAASDGPDKEKFLQC